jgi:Rrf2 family protein
MKLSLTRRGDYGLRALIFLARRPEGSMSLLREISAANQVPEKFLAQILPILVRAGIVRSRQGAGGGFSLGRPAAAITFLEVIEALDGPVAVNRCQMEGSPCDFSGDCAMEWVWEKAQEGLVGVLRDTTIGELVAREKHSHPGRQESLLT